MAAGGVTGLVGGRVIADSPGIRQVGAADGVDDHIILGAIQTGSHIQSSIRQGQLTVDANSQQVVLHHLAQTLAEGGAGNQQIQSLAIVVGLRQQFLCLFHIVGVVFLVLPLRVVANHDGRMCIVHHSAVAGAQAGDQALSVDGVADGLPQVDVLGANAGVGAGEEQLPALMALGQFNGVVVVANKLGASGGVHTHRHVDLTGFQCNAHLGGFRNGMEADFLDHWADTFRQIVHILPVIVAQLKRQDRVCGKLGDSVGRGADQLTAELIAACLKGSLADGITVSHDFFKTAHDVIVHLQLQRGIAGSSSHIDFGKHRLQCLFLGRVDVPGNIRRRDRISRAVGDALMDVDGIGKAVVLGGPVGGDPGLQLLVGVNNRKRFAHQVHVGRVAVAFLSEGGQAVRRLGISHIQHAVAAAGRRGYAAALCAGGSAARLAGSAGPGVGVAAAGGQQHRRAQSNTGQPRSTFG